MKAAETVERHVRVTIEGTAYHPDSRGEVLIVKRQDGGKVCLALGLGVTVEDIEPPRTWTDGDVVIDHITGAVWTREGGVWHRPGGMTVSDQFITADVAAGDTVLRYQAGGQ